MGDETWLCCICALKTFKSGTPCPHFKAGFCENEKYAHITGKTYVDRKKQEEAKTVGIGAISDE